MKVVAAAGDRKWELLGEQVVVEGLETPRSVSLEASVGLQH